MDEPTLTHTTCNGGDISLTSRYIRIRPEDREWPSDKMVEVPYCHRCKTVVDFNNVVRNVPITVEVNDIVNCVRPILERETRRR